MKQLIVGKSGALKASPAQAVHVQMQRRASEDKFETPDNPGDRDTRRSADPPSRTPVAPVRRSASGKRVVTLTKTQEAMAKRLGLTAQQYAAELIALENRNV